MVGVEQIHEWRGEDVYDTDGEKVGRLHEIFYDPQNGEPVLGAVRSGAFGRRSYLVPLADASAGRGYLRLSHSLEVIRGAQGGRRAETLEPKETRAAFEHFDMTPLDRTLESHTLVERRRAEVEEARQHADELEAEALKRADDVKDAHARADEAAREANAAEREGETARREALAARREAEEAEAAEGSRSAAGAGAARPEGAEGAQGEHAVEPRAEQPTPES